MGDSVSVQAWPAEHGASVADDERRRAPRYGLDVPALIRCNHVRFEGQLKDICRDAILFEGKVACALGATVSITAEILRGSGEVEITGRAIRTVPLGSGTIAVAVLFTELSLAASAQIETFLDQA